METSVYDHVLQHSTWAAALLPRLYYRYVIGDMQEPAQARKVCSHESCDLCLSGEVLQTLGVMRSLTEPVVLESVYCDCMGWHVSSPAFS